VTQVAPTGNAAAVPYTLTVNVATCTTSFQCNSAAAPFCTATGQCKVGPTDCVSDDAGDTTGGGDDGPAGGRTITAAPGAPASLTGKICSTPTGEVDFYKTTVANGAPITADLTWTGTDDLDLVVLDSTGVIWGADFWRDPT